MKSRHYADVIVLWVLLMVALSVSWDDRSVTGFLIARGDAIPAGFGAPYDVFNGNQIISASYASGKIEASTANADWTYDKGYYHDGNTWNNPFTFQGPKVCSKVNGADQCWINTQQNTPSASVSAQLPQGRNYVAAFTCRKVSGEWKCGCRTQTECGKWQVQSFEISALTAPPVAAPLLPDNECAGLPLEIVCGNDGVAYNNLCELAKAGTAKKSDGPCVPAASGICTDTDGGEAPDIRGTVTDKNGVQRTDSCVAGQPNKVTEWFCGSGGEAKSLQITCTGAACQDGACRTETTPTPTALTASCAASPNPAQINSRVTFTASPSGGTTPYTYTWSRDAVGSTRSATATFTTAGTKTAAVQVRDTSTPQKTATASCSVVVQAAATGNIVVRAKSDMAQNAGAQFDMDINGNVIGTKTATATFAEHSFTFSGTINSLRIIYKNDLYNTATGEDRNLWIDYVTISGQKYEAESGFVVDTADNRQSIHSSGTAVIMWKNSALALKAGTGGGRGFGSSCSTNQPCQTGLGLYCSNSRCVYCYENSQCQSGVCNADGTCRTGGGQCVPLGSNAQGACCSGQRCSDGYCRTSCTPAGGMVTCSSQADIGKKSCGPDGRTIDRCRQSNDINPCGPGDFPPESVDECLQAGKGIIWIRDSFCIGKKCTTTTGAPACDGETITQTQGWCQKENTGWSGCIPNSEGNCPWDQSLACSCPTGTNFCEYDFTGIRDNLCNSKTGFCQRDTWSTGYWCWDFDKGNYTVYKLPTETSSGGPTDVACSCELTDRIYLAYGYCITNSAGGHLGGVGVSCNLNEECTSGNCGGSGKCEAPAGIGESCSDGGACWAGWCDNGKCTLPPGNSGKPGMACSKDWDCMTRNCVNGICAAPLNEGGTCESDYNCGSGNCYMSGGTGRCAASGAPRDICGTGEQLGCNVGSCPGSKTCKAGSDGKAAWGECIRYFGTCNPATGGDYGAGQNPCVPNPCGEKICEPSGSGHTCIDRPTGVDPNTDAYNRCSRETGNSLSCVSCMNFGGAQLSDCIACVAGGKGGGVCAVDVTKCTGSASRPCTTRDDCEGTQQCANGVWGSCTKGNPPVCKGTGGGGGGGGEDYGNGCTPNCGGSQCGGDGCGGSCGACGGGERCDAGACVSACAGVTCGRGQYCSGGACVDNPICSVDCSEAEYPGLCEFAKQANGC